MGKKKMNKDVPQQSKIGVGMDEIGESDAMFMPRAPKIKKDKLMQYVEPGVDVPEGSMQSEEYSSNVDLEKVDRVLAEFDQPVSSAIYKSGADFDAEWAEEAKTANNNKFMRALFIGMLAAFVPMFWGILTIFDPLVANVFTASLAVAFWFVYDARGRDWARSWVD